VDPDTPMPASIRDYLEKQLTKVAPLDNQRRNEIRNFLDRYDRKTGRRKRGGDIFNQEQEPPERDLPY
jgi:hypothetical protein